MTERTVSFRCRSLASSSQSAIFQSASQNHFSAGEPGNRGPWCCPLCQHLSPLCSSDIAWVTRPLLSYLGILFSSSQRTSHNRSDPAYHDHCPSAEPKALLHTGQGTRMRGPGLYCRLGTASVWVPWGYGICIHMAEANFFLFFLLTLLGFALSELICNQGTTNVFSSASC